MQGPTQNKANHQCEKDQQRAGQRGFPEQKADFNNSDVLCDKYHREASQNKNKYQF
jgi:hypothetical protein